MNSRYLAQEGMIAAITGIIVDTGEDTLKA
jgi:hypothetical protein